MDYNIQILSKSINVLELVPMAQCTKIASIDAREAVSIQVDATGKIVSNSTNLKSYIDKNGLAYYVLLNTWGQQVKIVSLEAWSSLFQRIVLKGLLPVVRECNDLSDLLIHGESYDAAYTYGYLTPLIRACCGDLSCLLQLLRYPKRFSPLGASAVQSQSLQAFLSLNSEIKGENIRIHSSWYIFRLRHIIADMLKGFDVRLEDGYFSNGVASDAKKPLLSKLRMYRKYNANFSDSPLYPISDSYVTMEKWRGTKKNRGFVKVVAVPKSFKAARIIAEEPAATQFNLQAIAKGMIRAVEKNGYKSVIDVTDQTRNQELARLGSIDGSYATIDFSSASDSISEALAVDLLPADVSSVCLSNKQAYMMYNDTWSKKPQECRRLVQMWSTSGSAVTFISESIIIGSAAILSTQCVEVLLQTPMLEPSVCGDDVVIDDRCAEFFIDLVTRIGMKVNSGKSFFGKSPCGWYRESCGVEYLNGQPMHSRYFPRRPVAPSDEGLSSLIDLEKRLYADWTCRLFLLHTIRLLQPKMTASVEGSLVSDLWDTIDDSKVVTLRDSNGTPFETPHAERRKHLVLVSAATKSHLSDDDRRLLDMWYYHAYLLAGPLYADPLDRLLGVSTSRKNYDRDSHEPDLVWEYKLL